MALAGLSLLGGLGGGLSRLGWALPGPLGSLAAGHGPLMVVGFLGALVGLERAVAIKRPWAYGAPVAAGLAGLGLLAGIPSHAVHLLAVVASGFLLAIFLALYRREPEGCIATMALAAGLLAVGNLRWHLGDPLFRVAPWWIAFLALTIAGERLELSRLVRPGGAVRGAFFGAVGLVVGGLGLGLAIPDVQAWLTGLGLVALAAWLLRFDLAWRALGQGGLSRYMGAALLSGYVWLGVGGVLWLFAAPGLPAGPAYDAVLHSIFLGFVFSMIFAHVPVILPSVTGVALPFSPTFYAPLALLHLSVLLRVGGDLGGSGLAFRWGGLGNAVAIVLFLANAARSVAERRIPKWGRPWRVGGRDR